MVLGGATSPPHGSATIPCPLPARTQRFLQGPFAPGADLCSRTLAVSPDGKLLFSGGHWDNSLRVTSLAKGKVVGQITRHIGTSTSDDEGPMMPQWVCRAMGGGRGHMSGQGTSPSVSHLLGTVRAPSQSRAGVGVSSISTPQNTS